MKVAFAFVVLALLAVSVSADVDVPYQSCNTTADKISVGAIFATSWPPVGGQDEKITINGTSTETINGGSYALTVKFDGIPVINKKGNLNELGVLPIPAGPILLSKTISVPSGIPSGSLEIQVTATDDQGNELTCVLLDTNLFKTEMA